MIACRALRAPYREPGHELPFCQTVCFLSRHSHRFAKPYVWFAKWVVAPIVLGGLVIAGGVLLARQEIDFDTFLNYFALGLLIFVVITLFYGIIAIHDVHPRLPTRSRSTATIRIRMPFMRRAGLVCSRFMPFGRSCGSGRCFIVPNAAGASRTKARGMRTPRTGSTSLLRRVEELEARDVRPAASLPTAGAQVEPLSKRDRVPPSRDHHAKVSGGAD